MGKKKKRDKKRKKETDAKQKSQEPVKKWRKIISGTHQSLSSGWLQNFVVGLVILLLGPAAGMVIKSPKFAIVSFAMGLTAIIWILAVIAIRQTSNEQVRETETHGLLIPANDADPPNPCPDIPPQAMRIFLGNSASWTSETHHTVLQIAGQPIISLRRTDQGLSVSSKVFSADGRIVAELIDNRFHINPNNYFRTERPDKHSLLVFDQQARQVLTVRYLNPLAVKVLGVFNYPNPRPVIIEEDQITIGGNRFSRNCFGNNRVDIRID